MEIGYGELLRLAVDFVKRRLPSLLVARFYSDQRVASNVSVDLNSVRRIDFRFGATIPEIVVALRVTNLNPFPVRIDRLDVDLWIGQPIVKNHPVFVGRTVAAYSVEPPVNWQSGVLNGHMAVLVEFQLDELKLATIRRQLEAGRLANDVALRFEVHGRTLRREFFKGNQRIEISRDELPSVQLGPMTGLGETAVAITPGVANN
jgi:hypothetical protein